MTSSTPQSAFRAISPASVTTATSGTPSPVACSIRHVARASDSSERASTSTASRAGPPTSVRTSRGGGADRVGQQVERGQHRRMVRLRVRSPTAGSPRSPPSCGAGRSGTRRRTASHEDEPPVRSRSPASADGWAGLPFTMHRLSSVWRDRPVIRLPLRRWPTGRARARPRVRRRSGHDRGAARGPPPDARAVRRPRHGRRRATRRPARPGDARRRPGAQAPAGAGRPRSAPARPSRPARAASRRRGAGGGRRRTRSYRRPVAARRSCWPSPASPRCSRPVVLARRPGRAPAAVRVVAGLQLLFVPRLGDGHRAARPDRAAPARSASPRPPTPRGRARPAARAGAAGRRSAWSPALVVGQLVRRVTGSGSPTRWRHRPAHRGRRGRLRHPDRAHPARGRHPGVTAAWPRRRVPGRRPPDRRGLRRAAARPAGAPRRPARGRRRARAGAAQRAGAAVRRPGASPAWSPPAAAGWPTRVVAEAGRLIRPAMRLVAGTCRARWRVRLAAPLAYLVACVLVPHRPSDGPGPLGVHVDGAARWQR